MGEKMQQAAFGLDRDGMGVAGVGKSLCLDATKHHLPYNVQIRRNIYIATAV